MDITMSANRMVVTVEKTSEPTENVECRICVLTKGDRTNGRQRLDRI